MRRRAFIAGLSGAVAWPVTARAQQDGQQIRRIAAIIGFAKTDPEVESYIRLIEIP